MRAEERETPVVYRLPSKQNGEWDAGTPGEMRKSYWVNPQRSLSDHKIREWTADLKLRPARFVGYREDKDRVKMEREK